MTGRERVQAFLTGMPTDCLPCMPITMQFAAGRIGAKYREYATDCLLLTEGQIAVADEFGLDYVNVMSDPACEAADCGAEVVFSPDAPPALDGARALLMDKGRLTGLEVPDPTNPSTRMANRVRALDIYRERLRGRLLVEGWVEGPVAQAADLRGINTIMLDFYDDPDFVRRVFEFVLEMELRFAKAQVAAGADVIGIGDAAASLIGPRFYADLAWPYEKRMVDGIHAMGAAVRLHICGNTRRILGGMGKLGCDIVDLDFLVPVDEGRAQMGPSQALLGNIDPVRVLRDGTPDEIYNAIAECHRQAGPRYIVGPGCETPRDTPLANFRAMVAYAKEHTGTDMPEPAR